MVYHNLNTTQSATVYCELWQFGKLCKTKLMENHKNRRNRSQYHYLGHWKLSHYSTATKFTRWETKRSEKCWVSNNYSYNSVSGNHKKCYSLQWALSFKPNSTIFEVPTWILIFEWIWKNVLFALLNSRMTQNDFIFRTMYQPFQRGGYEHGTPHEGKIFSSSKSW